MAGNLKSRLSRIREVKREEARAATVGEVDGSDHGGTASTGATAAPRSLHPALASWREVGDLVYERELRFPCALPDSVDIAPFRSIAGARLGPATETVATESFRFFDLETTGLSGGSGTVAFLAASGHLEAGSLVLRQFFLADYPGEALFLERLLEDFPQGAVLATYNGKAFDLPLLRTRCVMNGIPPVAPAHVDLLFAARRLWKRPAGGASLGLLEGFVLGRERGEDVPGSRIPGIWLDFVRGGEAEELGAVLSHNAEDVASLALLLGRAAAVYAAPGAYRGTKLDLHGLGRGLLALGREAEGEAVLERAAARGDEAAAIALARRYARARRPTDRARMVALLGGSAAAEVERAKYLEHVERDHAAALACVDRAREALRLDEGLSRARRARLEAALAARRERLSARLGG